MQYAIFIPNVTGSTGDGHLQRLGLEALARDEAPDWFSVPSMRGQAGCDLEQGGLICSWRNHDAPEGNLPIGIRPDNFVWQASPPDRERELPKAAYYVGMHGDKKHWPGEAELRRPKQIPGTAVQLQDSRRWVIPAASNVDMHYGVDFETGEPTVIIDDRYEEYCRYAAVHANVFFSREAELEMFARVTGGRQKLSDEQEAILSRLRRGGYDTIADVPIEEWSVNFSLTDAGDQAWRALEINYRLNPLLITMLRLLTQQDIANICLAAIDVHAIFEALKKNEPELPISLPAGCLTSAGV